MTDKSISTSLPESLLVREAALPEQLAALAHQLVELTRAGMPQLRDISLEIYDPASGRILLEYRATR